MNKSTTNRNMDKPPEVISFQVMRKAIGILGISFPIILVIGSVLFGGCDEVQQSISAYYHTNMRNIFVGIICAVSFFLFSYRGYDWMDNLAGYMGCIFALGIAFLPCTVSDPIPPCLGPPININHSLVGSLHQVSAALFFLVLIIYSLYLFPKTHVDQKTGEKMEMSAQKKKRNLVYIISGCIMFAALLLILVYMWILEDINPGLKRLDPVFWLESVALIFFGISWLTKGQLILKDPGEGKTIQ